MRNNSFSGIIPEGFVELEELEVLDLGYNYFSGRLPADLRSDISLAILYDDDDTLKTVQFHFFFLILFMYLVSSCCSLLDNNDFLVGFSPEINELRMLSECQVDENKLTNAAKMPACTKRVTTWYVTN